MSKRSRTRIGVRGLPYEKLPRLISFLPEKAVDVFRLNRQDSLHVGSHPLTSKPDALYNRSRPEVLVLLPHTWIFPQEYETCAPMPLLLIARL